MNYPHIFLAFEDFMRSTFVPYFSLMLILESVNLNLVELSEHRLKWIEWYQKTDNFKGDFLSLYVLLWTEKGGSSINFHKM